jgi:pyruvate/2-oxoglutarate dehydrogenase complex dihydrolipoamide acyltransferase (E2) component
MKSSKPYRIEPIPKVRRFSLDAGYLGRRRHIIHGLIEVDVTLARSILSAHRARTGERLSFTAYVIACLSKALESNHHLRAHRTWRERLLMFDDLNITAMIEAERKGKRFPMPHVFEAVNTKSYLEVHEELRAAQLSPEATGEARFMRWFLVLPAFLRHWFYRIITRMPQLLPAYSSSVMVTAVGMFGSGGGWGVPVANFTLTVTVGGLSEKPGVHDGEIAIREYLDLTVSIDHDIVDGAPAARFVQEFRELLESGFGLEPFTNGNA